MQTAYQAEWYIANRERLIAKARAHATAHPEQARLAQGRYRAKNKDKIRCRSAVQQAVLRGDLVPLWCAACGTDKAEAHHPRYDRGWELDVAWLCRPCHRALHRRQK
jgi:hypothetical protein